VVPEQSELCKHATHRLSVVSLNGVIREKTIASPRVTHVRYAVHEP
jgi:hypothetical protein